jgi:hypothetical protein
MSVLQEIAQHVRATLAADETLTGLVGTRIRRDQGRDNEALPFMLFSFTGGTDRTALSGRPVLSRVLLSLQVIGGGDSLEPLDPILDAADAALSGTSATTATHRLTFIRQSQIEYAEGDEEPRINHLGYIYRVEARPIMTTP